MERRAKDGTLYQKVGPDEWSPITRLAKDGTLYRKVGADDWAPSGGAQAEAPKESKSVSAVRQFAQGGSMGFSDEIAGLGEAAGRVVGIENAGPGLINEMSLAKDGPTVDWETLRDAYRNATKKERDAMKKDMKDNPGISVAANLAGSIMSPVGKIMPGASLAKSGAAVGGISAAGLSEADNVGDFLKDTALGVGGGAVIGKVGEKVSPYIARAGEGLREKANSVGQSLKSAAEQVAFKAAGATLKDMRSKNANSVGRYLLDNKGVKAFDTVDDVAKRNIGMNKEAGERLEAIYSTAKEKFNSIAGKIGFDPKRDRSQILAAAKAELGESEGAAAALSKLGQYLDEVAERHGDKPMEEAQHAFKKELNAYMPKFKAFLKERKEYRQAVGSAGDDLNQPILAGTADDLQRTVSRPTQVEINGQAARVARPSVASANQPAVTQGAGQTKMVFTPQAPARPVNPGDVRNPMTPRGANDVKSAIDEKINYTRNPFSKEPATEKAFKAARRYVAKKIDDVIESLGGEKLAQDLKIANRDYGATKTVAQMAKDRVSRENANKMFGLTDTITAAGALGYGGTTGDWETAVGAMLGKKMIEKYGASTLAVGLDKASKHLLRSPKMQQVAKESPKVFQAAVIEFTKRLESKGAFSKAADNEPIPDRPSVAEKGPEKWASDGLNKLRTHGGSDLDSIQSKSKSDPKLKELLIKASDLKPGSRALEGISQQINSLLAKSGDTKR